MKRTIILVRHGKACSLDAFDRDIDRVLIKRGVSDGYRVAGEIMKSGIIPDLLLTSPAARASHSALIFARVMKTGSDKVRVIDDLYHGPGQKMLEEISLLTDKIKTVALFAHNPGITDLAETLSGGAVNFLPTTGVAIINYKTDSWSDIYKTGPTDFNFIFPKEIR
ncbi:MAG: hypothetical protein U5K32_05960 [Bacteroidales bacterium]|nr:hypothetical protein [Bacteroidales bacterium]